MRSHARLPVVILAVLLLAGPTYAVDLAMGTMSEAASTGSVEYDVTSFQPDLLIIMGTGTGNGTDNLDQHIALNFGACSGPSNEWSAGWRVEDSLATSDTASYFANDQCLVRLDETTNALEASAELTSLDTDGFTLNWTARTWTGFEYQWIAIGGLTNVHVGSSTLATGTGSQSFTGLGFDPDAIIAIVSMVTSLNTVTSHAEGCFSFGVSDGIESSTCFSDEDNQGTTDSQTDSKSFSFIELDSIRGSTYDREAQFTTGDPDGFTINHSTVGAARGAEYIGWIAMDVDNATEFALNDRSTTGAQTHTGLAFQPNIGFWHSYGDRQSNGSTTGLRLEFGVAIDSSNEYVVRAFSADAVTTSEALSMWSTTKTINVFRRGGSVIVAADFTTWTADGYTLNFSVADGGTDQRSILALQIPEPLADTTDAIFFGGD